MSRSLKLISLAGLAAAVMAAGPAPSLSAPAQNVSLPMASDVRVRPITTTVGGGFTNAPVPNVDYSIPFVKDPRQNQASLAPSVFAPPATGYRGEGYVPGSTAEVEQQRKAKPAGGINLKVPLN